MTTYNTMNPVPSPDPKDRYDNSQAFDEGMNSPNLTFIGRLGQTLQSWAGAVGYQLLGDYTDGATGQFTMTNFNQVFRRGGEFWRVKASVPMPYTTTNNWGTEGANFVSVGDAVLRNALASSGGAGMVQWLGSFANATQITQALKNTQYRHIRDFAPLPANTLWARAIEGTPAGGVLHTDDDPIVGNVTSSRSGITIMGPGPAPHPVADRSYIPTGAGTVVQGFTKFTGSNIKLINLAFDNGSVVTTALNGGVEKDCLVVSNVGVSLTPTTNNHIINCVTLAKVGAATAHSCLYENTAYGSAHGVTAYGGFVGFVAKSQECDLDNIVGRRNSQSGIQIKSSSNALSGRNRIGRLYADDEGLNAANSVGIFIYAESGQLQGIKGGSLSTRGFATGIGVTMVTGFPANDLHFDSWIAEGASNVSFAVFGGVVNTHVGYMQSIKPTSGRHVFIADEALGFTYGRIDADSPGPDLDDSVRIGGVSYGGDINTSINYAPGSITGITIIPNGTFPRSWGLGNYRGRLMINSGAGSSYLFDWTTGRSSPATCQLNGNRAFFNFCVVVPASRTGKENFYQVKVGLRPSKPEPIVAMGFASGTALAVPIYGEIDTDGIAKFPFLNNSTAFPTAVVFVAGSASWSLL